MLITLFEISKKFFDTIYSSIIIEEDIVENDIILDNFDEENRFYENSYDNDNNDDKNGNDDDELLGFDFLEAILFIYFRISKNLNPNKSD
jgi:hypothetical protein